MESNVQINMELSPQSYFIITFFNCNFIILSETGLS